MTDYTTELVDDGCEDKLLHNARYDQVIGPQDGKPWLQRTFMCFRPGWWSYLTQFMNLQEASGAFGDIGLFLPFLTALSIGRVGGKPQIEFGSALFYAGVFTMGLSTCFNIPIPVQPMKTIAAVAIAEKYSNTQILAAGMISGVVMFVLAVSNIITRVNHWIPIPVVRGIQLGVGISIMMSGLKAAYVTKLVWTKTPFKVKEDSSIVWIGIDSVMVSLLLGLFCILCRQTRRIPVALILFLYGLIVAIYQYFHLRDEYHLPMLQFGPDFQSPVFPSRHDFQQAFIHLFLPQLPLTLLNSVIALEKLAIDLYPTHDHPAHVKRICYSIASGNLLFCWLGMLPVCHGAGGLASQHTFGARSSLAMIFLGIFKLVFALLFGSSCVVLLQKGMFPQSVVGVMLVFSGLSLSGVGLKIDHTSSTDTLLMILTAAGCLGLNTGAGFLIGMTVVAILRVQQYFQHK